MPQLATLGEAEQLRSGALAELARRMGAVRISGMLAVKQSGAAGAVAWRGGGTSQLGGTSAKFFTLRGKNPLLCHRGPHSERDHLPHSSEAKQAVPLGLKGRAWLFFVSQALC